MEALDALGASVVVEASHTCMSMRGVHKPGALMITSAIRGLFKTNLATRNEFLSFVANTRAQIV